MATANKRSKKTSAGRSATAKKTTGTRASAARKPAAAARKPTGKGAAKTATGQAAKKATVKKAAPKKAAKKATVKKAAPKKAAKKAAPKKAAAKKTAAKKTAAKKTAAKKTAAKKTAAKKTATKKTATKKAAPKKTATKKTAAPKAGARKTRATARKAPVAPPVQGEPALFQPLSEGERAAALRLLTEDPRLAGMASVGRYRVIAVEPLVVKPKHELSKRRLARVVVYDYAAERSVDACIDVDSGTVTHLSVAHTQPMLSREEEAAAIAIALGDEQVRSKLSPGDEPQVAMHYWSRAGTSLAYSRRSAAVLLGQPGRSPSLVAVVDLLDDLVCELVPAAEW